MLTPLTLPSWDGEKNQKKIKTMGRGRKSLIIKIKYNIIMVMKREILKRERGIKPKEDK